jgi:hypothetical protein
LGLASTRLLCRRFRQLLAVLQPAPWKAAAEDEISGAARLLARERAEVPARPRDQVRLASEGTMHRSQEEESYAASRLIPTARFGA